MRNLSNEHKVYLTDWQVKGYYPHVPHLAKSMETGQQLLGVTDWLPATVPGAVQHDLWRAGWIDDPYVGLNSLHGEWVENRWWMYRTRFEYVWQAGTNIHLHLAGIDYKAHIYFDQNLLCSHENMFVPLVLDVTEYFKEAVSHELIVLCEHAPDEMAQIGYTSKTRTQKSRFAYKWDFSTRMVPIGLWDRVWLETTGSARVDEVKLAGVVAAGQGVVRTEVRCAAATSGQPVKRLHCRAELLEDGKRLAVNEADIDEDGGCQLDLCVRDPKLWYPNGAGDQALYEVRIELLADGRISDQWHGSTGFRTVEWLANDGAPDRALPYTVSVNGRKIYIKGVNLTPLDQLYGTVTKERYEQMVLRMKLANVNLVRVWGGGIIEREMFYECCDRAGIMVWQEFIQSSSGIDNIPSKHPDFLRQLERTASHALKTRRNHVCLVCWSGGNELTDAAGQPATYEDENIAMLKRLVEKFDSGRAFLPTSASGPREFLSLDHPGENHDVHGPWKYAGDSEHYELYNRSDSLLHSEFGVDACCSLRSMREFLPREALKIDTMKDNAVWRHHGEWWDTLDRDTRMFGAFDSLEDFAKASQWIQAEGIRYALEANRRRKYRNSGSIIWQFNEPFPNVSCTSLIDYYMRPKMAYYALARAYSPVHVSLRYDKLIFRSDEVWEGDIYLHNSLGAFDLHWRMECFDLNGVMLAEREGCARVRENCTEHADKIRLQLGDHFPDVFAVRLRTNACEDNTYWFSTKQTEPFRSLLHAPSTSIIATRDAEDPSLFEVSNKGEVCALFVHPSSEGEPLLSLGNGSVILPGEAKRMRIIGGTQSADCSPYAYENREISFVCWNGTK